MPLSFVVESLWSRDGKSLYNRQLLLIPCHNTMTISYFLGDHSDLLIGDSPKSRARTPLKRGQRHAPRRFTTPPWSIDTHADTPQRFLDEGFDIGSTDPNDIGHISLDKARRGNLGAEFFSIWVEPETNQGHYARHTFDLIDSVYEQAARHPDRMMMAFSTADIERAHREHKLAALMGIEGGHSIENDIHLLRDYYRLGVRYMTLSWSNTNEWADSSGDINDPKIQHHNGLTDFGKQVVLEMNRLGMMVDISHVADKTFWDAIATTKAPVIASHSSARALVNAPRNMTDDMLKAVAKNGGVVQVNFFNGFIDENFRKAEEAQRQDQECCRDRNTSTQMKSRGQGGQLHRTRPHRARVDGEDSASAAEVADRPHRSHRQGRRSRPRGPGVRLRRRQRSNAAGHRLSRRSAEDHAGAARSRL